MNDAIILTEKRPLTYIFDTGVLLLGWLGFLFLVVGPWFYEPAEEIYSIDSNISLFIFYLCIVLMNASIVIIWASINAQKKPDKVDITIDPPKYVEKTTNLLLKNARRLTVFHNMNGHVIRAIPVP